MKQAKKENKEAKAFTKDCSIDDYVEFCSSENLISRYFFLKKAIFTILNITI